MHTYWIYILASGKYGTLYVGVTNSVIDRVALHREGVGSKFTARYGVTDLVYYEMYQYVDDALQREKSLKKYKRDWKINLIERDNPGWLDLYPAILETRG